MRSYSTQGQSLVHQVARDHNLRSRISRDDDTEIIPGKRGNYSHIFQYSEFRLGVIFTSDARKPARTRHWRKYREVCLAAGMSLTQNGDCEGTFTFDADNQEQVRLAIGLAEIRRCRRLSPEARARAISNLQRFRSNPRQEALISDQERSEEVATTVLSRGP